MKKLGKIISQDMDSPTLNGNKINQRLLRRKHKTTLSPKFSKQFAPTPKGYASRGRI